MREDFKINSNLLAKNTILNFMGQVLPIIVAFFSIPYVVKGLGVERFGILALAWVVLNYFTIFDMGMGRATTKYISEALGKGEIEKIPSIVWTSLFIQIGFGLIGTCVMLLLTPIITKDILKIPDILLEEATTSFYILSFLLIVIVSSRTFQGILEAAQKFSLVNAVQVPLRILTIIVPVVGVVLNAELSLIISCIGIAWLLSLILYFLLSNKIFTLLKDGLSFNKAVITPLLNFGSWTTLCNIIIPILNISDRFFIGVIVSIEAVAYYTVAFDAISQLFIIPSVIAMTLFPAYSSLFNTDRESFKTLYLKSIKFVLLILGPPCIIIIFFANEFLYLWMGQDFAQKSTIVLQMLAIGVLLNAPAWMSATTMDGFGRPDLRAKLFLCYLPIYLIIMIYLLKTMGIPGAAAAWTIRAMIEIVLFSFISWKYLGIKFRNLEENMIIQTMFFLIVLSLVLFLILKLTEQWLFIRTMLSLICVLFFLSYAWKYMCEYSEKIVFLKILGINGLKD